MRSSSYSQTRCWGALRSAGDSHREALSRPHTLTAVRIKPMSASAAQPAASVRDQRIPDFFIVGHAKCGTTALYEMLRRHPQIFMPEYKAGAGKEPWYFARDNPNPQTDGVRD